MPPRRHRSSTSVMVHVEINDVIDELDDDDIIEIARERGIAGFAPGADSVPTEIWQDVRELLLRRQPDAALALLDRHLARTPQVTEIWNALPRDPATGRLVLFS